MKKLQNDEKYVKVSDDFPPSHPDRPIDGQTVDGSEKSMDGPESFGSPRLVRRPGCRVDCRLRPKKK